MSKISRSLPWSEIDLSKYIKSISKFNEILCERDLFRRDA